jgi:hypothetical protein
MFIVTLPTPVDADRRPDFTPLLVASGLDALTGSAPAWEKRLHGTTR